MNHLPDAITMENAPLEIDSNTLPKEDDNLRTGMETTQCNAGEKKKKKRRRKCKSLKSKDIDNNHPKDTSVPKEDDNLRTGMETTQCNAGEKKKKKRRRRCKSLKSKDIDNNHPKDTSVNINPIKLNSVLHPPVTACLSMDLEITQHNVEVISSQNVDNGKKLNGSHDALISNDTNQDFQEGGRHPSRYSTNIEFVEREDANSVSEVAVQLNSYERCLDASSTKKHDDLGEVDINSSDMSSIKTCLRKERVARHRRNSRKFSKSRVSSLESIKENASHSVLVVQDNSMRDASLAHSDEVVVSSEQGMGQVVTGHGASLLVARDCSLKKSSGECSDGEPASGKPEENIKTENLEGIINKLSLVKDASEVDLREKNLEKGNKDKLDVTQNVMMDASAEDNFHKSTTFDKEDKTSDHSYSRDPSIMNIESDNFDIQPQLKDAIPSSSQLGGMAHYDCEVTQVVIRKEGPQQRLQSSPEGGPPGRKKLLVLDVNGLLADIVPYESVSGRYKPDTFISMKAVFKRPFCDDFLQFCFERFHVGVWSSRTKRNVESVLDFLMGRSKCNLLFCWDQSHCTDTGFYTVENRAKPLLLKELKKLWEKHEPGLQWKRGDYNESNTLLLDDSPYKALRNPPHTAIFPHTFQYKDVKDNSLGPSGDLRVYLEGLALADNVQKYVELNPFGQRPITKTNLSWAFYLKVIGTTSSRPKEEDANDSSACS